MFNSKNRLIMKKIKLVILALLISACLSATEHSFRTQAVNWMELHNISQEGIVVLISMLPIIELRGAIPVGIFMFHFSWFKSALLSIIGNMLPIPFVLLLMDGFVSIVRRTKLGCKFTDWLFARTRRKGKVIEKYKAVGLTIFVGIPLPGTGGWTGAFAANIFGIRFWKSLLFIFLGVLLSAVIVTILCQMGLIIFQ